MMSRRSFACAVVPILAGALLLAGCGPKGEAAEAPNGAVAGPAVESPADAAVSGPRDWTRVVTQTPEGGYLMGNPQAKVKLVEYGSLTCPHCAEFEAKGAPVIEQRYVRSGKLSFEFRNFVRDPMDMAAALLSRCTAPEAYFKLTDQLFAAQPEWLGKLEKLGQAGIQQLNALPPSQMMAELAKLSGLDRFVALRGVPSAKARACLADQRQQQKLADMRGVATQKYNLQGTPTFVLNGKTVEGVFDWASLEPALKSAIGS